jgi:hypothetical protein
MFVLLRRGLTLTALALLLLVMDALSMPGAHASAPVAKIVGPPSYHISLFAKGTSSYFNPDSITVDGKHIFVSYMNNTLHDGSDHQPSTIVEYNDSKQVLHIFSVLGHCDGLRVDPTTHLVWALVNNDANPGLYTINPVNQQITSYTFPAPPHGGGYDDLAFVNGMAFISASNPTLDGSGNNVNPAVDQITLSGNTVVLTPVLYGNATATDITTGQTVTLNEVDPDALSLDPQGDVVLVNQAGSELVFIKNPGSQQQSVSRLLVGTQLDDTVWATSTTGHLFVVDKTLNAIYLVRSSKFVVGTAYTEAPSDSGVNNFVGTVNLTTGLVTPVLTGFSNPTGLIFVQG